MSSERYAELSDEQLLQLNELTEQFEVELSAGSAPSIESVVEQAPAEIRSALLAELIAVEVEHRQLQGEAPSHGEYLQRFPYDGPPISSVFADISDEPLPPEYDQTVVGTQSILRDDTQPALEPATGDMPEEFGRYQIEKVLGEGGMGSVYLARDTQLGRRVALKVPKLVATDADGIERFQREARAMATVEHPNLCPVYDVGEIDGRQYLTMAFVDGPTLTSFLRKGYAVPGSQAAAIVQKLALALQVAHEAGIVHRDLKPPNVMINSRNEPVIMDFGLARQENPNDETLTREGMIVGSPAYMSPEQVGGEAVGPQSDIYSLGVMLYEMLCGRRPYEGSVMSVLGRITSVDPEPVGQVHAEVHPKLSAICMKALSRDPTERFASAAEFAEALGDFLRVEGAAALAETGEFQSGGDLANQFFAAGAGTDALEQTVVTAAPSAGGPTQNSRRGLLIGGGATLLALFAGLIVYTIRTPYGDVTVTHPEGVNVEIELKQKGKVIAIAGPDNGWSANVEEGAYQISLKPIGGKAAPEKGVAFRLQGNGTLIVSKDGKNEVVIVATPRKRPGEQVSTVTVEQPGTGAVRSVGPDTSQLLPRKPVPTKRSTGWFVDSGQELGNSTTLAVAAGDLDGDGDVDVVVANRREGEASCVWLNDGTGQFEIGQEFTGRNAGDVTLGDFDADGDLDVIVARDDVVSPGSVLLNQGDGTFKDSGQKLQPMYARAIAVGDLDHDGALDFFAVGREANQVWMNDGSGNFLNSEQELGALESHHVALGDLDGDGDLDAFVCNHEANRVWLNDGTGRFLEGRQSLGGSFSLGVALSDVDDDGDLDACVANYSHRSRLWINDGRAQFTPIELSKQQLYSGAVALADLNGDGVIDVFLCNGHTEPTNDSTNQTLLRNSQGSYRASSLLDDCTKEVALADFDGDGDLDAFLAVRSQLPNRILLNQDLNTPKPPLPTIRFRDSGQRLGNSSSQDVSLGDVDDDGDLDALVANYTNDHNRLWLNDGLGKFRDSGQKLGNFVSSSVELVDLDDDQDLDAFIVGREGPHQIWLNDGKGRFEDSKQRLGESRTKDVAIGDLDGDGDPDAFEVNYNRQPNRVWLNQGDGRFKDSGQSLGEAYSYGVSLGDLDGDGDLDAAVANRRDEPNQIWLNDGNGKFSASPQDFGDSSTTRLAIGDVDNDDDLDLVASNSEGSNRVWLNDGSGVFERTDQTLGGFWTRCLALADLDKDGDLDVFLQMPKVVPMRCG